MPSLKDIIVLLLSTWRWVQSRNNPARAQAGRVLRVFGAHGIQPTQINRHMPVELRLPGIKWSTVDYLKEELSQDHIEWINDYFALDLLWLEGEAGSVHQQIRSYKAPGVFYEWVTTRNLNYNHLRSKIYLITADDTEINPQTQGAFSLVLEQFAEEEQKPSRYFFLTEGAHFSHPPCVLHLMQILAIAHSNGVIMQRSILGTKPLKSLTNNLGFIPEALAKCRRHRLAADHELWSHYSGSSPWLDQLRAEVEMSLMRAGMSDVVLKFRADSARWARK